MEQGRNTFKVEQIFIQSCLDRLHRSGFWAMTNFSFIQFLGYVNRRFSIEVSMCLYLIMCQRIIVFESLRMKVIGLQLSAPDVTATCCHPLAPSWGCLTALARVGQGLNCFHVTFEGGGVLRPLGSFYLQSNSVFVRTPFIIIEFMYFWLLYFVFMHYL